MSRRGIAIAFALLAVGSVGLLSAGRLTRHQVAMAESHEQGLRLLSAEHQQRALLDARLAAIETHRQAGNIHAPGQVVAIRDDLQKALASALPGLPVEIRLADLSSSRALVGAVRATISVRLDASQFHDSLLAIEAMRPGLVIERIVAQRQAQTNLPPQQAARGANIVELVIEGQVLIERDPRGAP